MEVKSILRYAGSSSVILVVSILLLQDLTLYGQVECPVVTLENNVSQSVSL